MNIIAKFKNDPVLLKSTLTAVGVGLGTLLVVGVIKAFVDVDEDDLDSVDDSDEVFDLEAE